MPTPYVARARAPEAVIGGVAVFVLGTVIGWLGLLLRWSSFASLGGYFTTVVMASADQVVLRRGPYQVLRHPSYTGLLLVFIGCGLMLGNWLGVVASFPLILAGLVYRLLREERLMTETVGDAYLDFARDRARLIPFIW